MNYAPSSATAVFFCVVAALAGLIFLFGRKPGSVNAPRWLCSLALAGDHVSAAFFVGICGAIAFYGYDGFLYAIGAVAGIVLLRFLTRGRTSRYASASFNEALNARFPLHAVRRVTAISTLVCGVCFVVPHVVAVLALVKPLGGGTLAGAGLLVFLLPLVSFRSGATFRAARTVLLVLVVAALAFAVMRRGLQSKDQNAFPRRLSSAEFSAQLQLGDAVLHNNGPWAGRYYVRVRHADGSLSVWSFVGMQRLQLSWPAATFTECQLVTATPDGKILVNGLPQNVEGGGTAVKSLRAQGFVQRAASADATGPFVPLSFLSNIQQADLAMPRAESFDDAFGHETIYYAAVTSGQDLLAAGNDPALFPGIRSGRLDDRLNFVSFMLALLCGTAALRFGDSSFARIAGASNQNDDRATLGLLAMVVIALFYLLSLFVGLGAMTSGHLDPSDGNLSLPLLAKSFGDGWLGAISAIFMLAILAAIADVMLATARRLSQEPRMDLTTATDTIPLRNYSQSIKGVVLLMIAVAIVLGAGLQHMSVAFLFTWCFNVVAATNLPALTLGLNWKRATPAAVMASMLVGLASSVLWILVSREAGLTALMPFNQPALVTLPLSFIALIAVSLLTRGDTKYPSPNGAYVNSQG